MHGRHEEAQLLRQLAAHAAHARQQFATLGGIHQRHQAVAHFQSKEVHGTHVIP